MDADHDWTFIHKQPQRTVPEASDIKEMIEECRKEYARISAKRGLERRCEKRRLAQWDWEKNHGRRAFRNARDNYRPPTSPLQHQTKKGEYIVDCECIHNQFLGAWEKIYCIHKEDSQIWATFETAGFQTNAACDTTSASSSWVDHWCHSHS